MKRVILPLLLAVFALSSVLYAQEAMIDSLSNVAADTNFVWAANVEGGASTFAWVQDAADKPAGFNASLDVKAKIDSLHPWGSFAQLIYRLPTGDYMDLSSSDTLRLWIKVVKAPLFPQYMSFRIQLVDQDAPGDPLETFIYQNDTNLDTVSSWYQLKMPLHMIDSQNGTVVPADSGFVEAPFSWGGFTWNNHKLDLDKIVGWNIVMVTTTTGLNPNPPTGYTNVPLDSLDVKFAGFDRTGNKAVPVTFFNGLGLQGNETLFSWNSGSGGSVAVETGNGPVTNTNSIHWTTAASWNGFGFNIGPPAGSGLNPDNIGNGWPVDSLKFMYKADFDSLIRVQFESGWTGSATIGKVSTSFTPVADGSWHQFSYPLRDITDVAVRGGFQPR